MTQPTGISPVGGKVEVSTNNSDWTDWSDHCTGIEFSGFDRKTGEVYTFSGDNAVIGFGKVEPTECTVHFVYTSSSTGPFATAWGQHTTAGGGMMMVRFSPQGGDTTGEDKFTSGSDSKIKAMLPPDAEADTGEPMLGAFTIKTAAFSLSNAT